MSSTSGTIVWTSASKKDKASDVNVASEILLPFSVLHKCERKTICALE